MSYSIKVRTEGGRVVHHEVSGEVPDGEHEISGHVVHEGSGEHNLAVSRKAADGHVVARVGSAHQVPHRHVEREEHHGERAEHGEREEHHGERAEHGEREERGEDRERD